jgi:hypothetical protein
MNEIWYNNKNAFSGICYTPFVSFNRESDGWWQSIDTFNLEGEIVGCGVGFSGMLLKQQQLVSNFAQNFKNFQIKEDNNIIYNADNVIIRDISFDESNYAYILPFTVNVEVFDPLSFSGKHFVTNPVDEFVVEENNNRSVNISHSVSANGVTNKNAAIYNARNWVYSRTGLNNFIKPAFINIHDNNLPTLVSISEFSDRLNGTYSIKEDYIFDQANIVTGIIRYSNTINKDLDNFTTVSINGSIEGGLGNNIQNVRNQYKTLDLWSLAFDVYSGCTNNGDLNSFYLTSGVNENLQSNTIEFNAVFNNDNSPIIAVKSTASFNLGYDIQADQDSAEMVSEITCRVGNQSERYTRVVDYFNTKFNPLNEFIKNIDEFNNNDYNLSYFKLAQENVTYSESASKIIYKCNWSINKINTVIPCYIKSLTYGITKSYSLQQYEFKQPLCSEWSAYGTHEQPQTIQIQGNASFESGKYIDTLNFIQQIVNEYKLSILTAKTINEDLDGRKVSFTYVYTE